MLSATEWATLTAAQAPVKRGKYKLLVVCRPAPSMLLQQLPDISKTKKGRMHSIKSLFLQYNPRTRKASVRIFGRITNSFGRDIPLLAVGRRPPANRCAVAPLIAVLWIWVL